MDVALSSRGRSQAEGSACAASGDGCPKESRSLAVPSLPLAGLGRSPRWPAPYGASPSGAGPDGGQALGTSARDDSLILSSRGRSQAEGSACAASDDGCPRESRSLAAARDDNIILSSRGQSQAEGSAVLPRTTAAQGKADPSLPLGMTASSCHPEAGLRPRDLLVLPRTTAAQRKADPSLALACARDRRSG